MLQTATLTSSLIMAASVIAFAEAPARGELDIREYVSRYRAHDQARNGGVGYSTHTDSSTLAWGESYILCDYIRLYRVTGDVYWLEKVTQHFDQMIYGMTQDAPQTDFRLFSTGEVDKMVREMIKDVQNCDFDELDQDAHPLWNTRYPGWYTDRYSVAHVQVTGRTASPDREDKSLDLVPDTERITDIARAHKITGHDYEILFEDGEHYSVVSFDSMRIPESGERTTIARSVKLGESITEIPGASFKLKGKPRAGDGFSINTVEPKPLQYAVHDGMVLYPIAQLIEIVMNDDGLQEQFLGKVESYTRLIREVFVTKWERYWMEMGNDAGAYSFTISDAQRFSERLLPHNQYNALCRVYLVLQDRNVLDDPGLREKARKMVRYFRSNLRITGDAWTWNYWDWGTGDDEHSGVEDSSHASINVGTAIEAYHRGMEFERQDMVRFTRTLLDQMWNGSLEDPVVGDRVDTNEGDQYFPIRHWIELCEFDPEVLDVCRALFRRKDEPRDLIPVMLHAQTIGQYW